MAEMTPLMEQYCSIKKDYQKEVLFFRLGDFYEMFNEDAIEVSRLLNLTLTHRGDNPMCGIPYHAAKIYIARLLRLGKKIAICEQTSAPTQGKGLTERKVIEVITPGNAVEEEYLEQGSNNFLAALCFVDIDKDSVVSAQVKNDNSKKCVSFSYVDISTGVFCTRHWACCDTAEELSKELGRILPRELIIAQTLENNKDVQFIVNQFSNMAVSYDQDWLFSLPQSYKRIITQFSTTNLKSFGLTEKSPEIATAGYLLYYLANTSVVTNSSTVIPHITNLVVLKDSQFVVIDDSSRRNLEIMTNLRDGSSKYSLLETIQYTVTAMGSRLLRTRLSFPLFNVNQISNRQKRVALFFDNGKLLQQIRNHLSSILDVERLAVRVAMEKAHAKDLQALRLSLESYMSVRALLTETEITSGVNTDIAQVIIDNINNSILLDPSTSLTDGGIIKEGWSTELDHYREIQSNFSKILEDYLEEERQRTGIPNLKIKYSRNIGYFMEVSRGKINSVPSHFILRRALVNGDRYTSPRLQELEQELLTAGEKIIETEKNLFLEIRQNIAKETQYLLSVASEIAELDVSTSLAHGAVLHNWVCPIVDDSSILNIEDGRHPVVEFHMNQGQFVPNSALFDEKKFALITGPNMAGKSTYLRQNALIVLLAQIGSFVPAKTAHIGIVDKIFCRVGASDNLARGESTFLVEMTETALILRSATEKSLVIMDEVGRGTSTEDGLSIAWAVSEFLLNSIKAKTFFATHYHELTRLVHPALQLLCLDVLENDGKIVFLKRIKAGASANSYGIHVAYLAGIPSDVINRANQILQSLQNKTPYTQIDKISSNLESSSLTETCANKLETDKVSSSNNQLSASGLFSDEELVIDDLLSVDPNSMTPLEALQKIATWHKNLSGK